jgi:hypothetical protein
VNRFRSCAGSWKPDSSSPAAGSCRSTRSSPTISPISRRVFQD